MAISHDDCQDDQSCENGIWHTLFWAFSDGVRLLWMVVNAQGHRKCVSNQSCLTRSWQQDGVSVGVPSEVIDRLRILWIFGFGHHKHHIKGCRHNQEKSAFVSKIWHCSFWCFNIKVNPWNLFCSRFIFNSTSLQIEVAHIPNQWPCQGPTWNSLGRSANFQAVVRLISIFISSAWTHSLLPLPSRDLWVSLFQLPRPLTLGGTGGNVGNC